MVSRISIPAIDAPRIGIHIRIATPIGPRISMSITTIIAIGVGISVLVSRTSVASLGISNSPATISNICFCPWDRKSPSSPSADVGRVVLAGFSQTIWKAGREKWGPNAR